MKGPAMYDPCDSPYWVPDAFAAEAAHGPLRDDGLPVCVRWHGHYFETPDFEDIEAWCLHDGGADSLLGLWVEPDGTDEHGAPAWPRALGPI